MNDVIFDVKPKLLIPYILICSFVSFMIGITCLIISLPLASFLIWDVFSKIWNWKDIINE